MQKDSTALGIDRYHAVMGEFSLRTLLQRIEQVQAIGDMITTFYVTQRKIKVAPAVGQERIVDFLNASRADEARARFLREDRAKLALIAEKLRHSRFPGEVWAVAPGTILFAQEPIALVKGPFAMTQLFEDVFEHAFDEPMTWASIGMNMKGILGYLASLSDFALRRAGGLERAIEASRYLYIGGCDDTSNMEAAFRYGMAAVGTMAHYLVQLFMALVELAKKEKWDLPASWFNEDGSLKHGQRICFECWLDAFPDGTVCLIDTISVKLGMIHAIEAALSSPKRRKALKAVRLDTYDGLKRVAAIFFMREILDLNGLTEVKIVVTGDLDAKALQEMKDGLRNYISKLKSRSGFDPAKDDIFEFLGIMGVAVGTKGVAEIEKIAGVIFKMVEFEGIPTLKLSSTPGKETLPGVVQIWRHINDNGQFIYDSVALADEYPFMVEGTKKTIPLLAPFWKEGKSPELPTDKEQKDFVNEQLRRFIFPVDRLEEYGRTRVRLSPRLECLKEDIATRYCVSPETDVMVPDWVELEE